MRNRATVPEGQRRDTDADEYSSQGASSTENEKREGSNQSGSGLLQIGLAWFDPVQSP